MAGLESIDHVILVMVAQAIVRVGRQLQKAFMGWAYMSFAVSGARPKESSIVDIRLYSL